MSKKQKYTLKQIKTKTTDKLFKKLEVLYELFKRNLTLYKKYKALEDQEYVEMFISMFRSPIWDVTSTNLFKSGLKSTCVTDIKPVDDHFIQRIKAAKFLFEIFCENPKTTFVSFLNYLVKYGSTVALTKEEHTRVTHAAKKTKEVMNFQIYESCGVEIPGLNELLQSLEIEST